MNHGKSQITPTGRATSAALARPQRPRDRDRDRRFRTPGKRLCQEPGAAPEVVENVALAVSEAVTNVVKHGYERERPGTVTLAASMADGLLELRVADQGLGFREKESDGLGLGLSIIVQVSAELDVSQSLDGTEPRMRFALAQR